MAEPKELDPRGMALWDEVERHVQAGGSLPMPADAGLRERLLAAAAEYSTAHSTDGYPDEALMRDVGFAHGHLFAIAADSLAAAKTEGWNAAIEAAIGAIDEVLIIAGRLPRPQFISAIRALRQPPGGKE